MPKAPFFQQTTPETSLESQRFDNLGPGGSILNAHTISECRAEVIPDTDSTLTTLLGAWEFETPPANWRVAVDWMAAQWKLGNKSIYEGWLA